ncbi:MAG: glycosyltransferase [Bryobacterales bacterium]|nr:glycosyltransferase [Bryobacteraceae bacterium]MDW8354514.1 glycosyltransferase [Bryobacterales bacterium]
MSPGGSPRVAVFTDCYYETNGVARTYREFERYARERNLPLLIVRNGPSDAVVCHGAQRAVEFRRSRLAFAVDVDLWFDPLFFRRLPRLRPEVRAFGPDVIHITGPGDVGLLGAILAAELGVPLCATWHTNLHEFAERRLLGWLGWLPLGLAGRLSAIAARAVLAAVLRFYRIPRAVFAPTAELVDLLRNATGRPVYRMGRGIDTRLFHPSRRSRNGDDGTLVLGYVGRLVPEKNVRLLASVERALIRAGIERYRFVVVGEGWERPWLERELQRAQFTGRLHGEALAQAYADMDLFVFPSRTDTFGNVVQEALASGVPAVVTDGGGPKFLVRNGETGRVARSDEEFCQAVIELAADPARLHAMRERVRNHGAIQNWDDVFERMYAVYEELKVGPRRLACVNGFVPAASRRPAD